MIMRKWSFKFIIISITLLTLNWTAAKVKITALKLCTPKRSWIRGSRLGSLGTQPVQILGRQGLSRPEAVKGTYLDNKSQMRGGHNTGEQNETTHKQMIIL